MANRGGSGETPYRCPAAYALGGAVGSAWTGARTHAPEMAVIDGVPVLQVSSAVKRKGRGDSRHCDGRARWSHGGRRAVIVLMAGYGTRPARLTVSSVR